MEIEPNRSQNDLPTLGEDRFSQEGEFIMEIKQFATLDPELEALAAKIKPLPEDIVPSAKFVAEMRLRILQLEKPEAVRRAA